MIERLALDPNTKFIHVREIRLTQLARLVPLLEEHLLFIEEFPYVFITVIRDAKRAISHIEGSCSLWSSTEQSEQMW